MHKVEVARGRGYNVAPDSERHGGDKGLSFAFPYDGNIRNTSKHCTSPQIMRVIDTITFGSRFSCIVVLTISTWTTYTILSLFQLLFSHKTMPSNRSERPSANISSLETKALDDRSRDWWCWERPWSKRFVSYCRWIKPKFHDSPTLPRPCFRNGSTTRKEVSSSCTLPLFSHE